MQSAGFSLKLQRWLIIGKGNWICCFSNNQRNYHFPEKTRLTHIQPPYPLGLVQFELPSQLSTLHTTPIHSRANTINKRKHCIQCFECGKIHGFSRSPRSSLECNVQFLFLDLSVSRIPNLETFDLKMGSIIQIKIKFIH